MCPLGPFSLAWSQIIFNELLEEVTTRESPDGYSACT